MNTSSNLKSAIQRAIEFLEGNKIAIPLDLRLQLHGVFAKTAEELANAVDGLVILLYNKKITVADFTFRLAGIIDTQLVEAWAEGMAENGYSLDEITPEWAEQLQTIITNEQSHILSFGQEIEQDRINSEPIEPLLSRADLWGNRYNEVVNAARLATANAGDKLVWRFGDADHCTTCAELDGIVASASEWQEAGVSPQSPPNEKLECGGWRCQCSLEPTDEKRTRNALEKILGIINA